MNYEPNEHEMPRCPVCGAETNDFFRSYAGQGIVGCTECVCRIDAWDVEI